MKGTEFGQVGWEVVDSKMNGSAREIIRMRYISIMGFRENLPRTIYNNFTCTKSGPFSQVMNN